MQASEFICPHCMYKAQLSMFENVGGGEMRCRCCRSKFKDPNAYDADVAYADCDSTRPATHFPFSLNEESARIRVRNGYLAFLAGTGGQRQWIEEPDYHVSKISGGFQLYYVCMTPWIMWGVGSLEEFGAYGRARLSLSKEYVVRFCDADGQVLALEERLRKAVSQHIAEHIRRAIERQSTGFLENRNAYMGMIGELEEGVNLTHIEPMGYRNAAGKIGAFSTYLPSDELIENEEELAVYTPPVDIVDPPKSAYTVKNGIEEVFCYGSSKMQRHKAGDKVTAELLRNMDKLVRYKIKEFEYPFGWGIYNQPLMTQGYYSAHGTLSFYIDSTERFSSLLYKAKTWHNFETQFFTNILKRELSEALREVMASRVGRQYFQQERIGDYLSAMSVDLTNMLNGEGKDAKEPVFRQYGLRVKQTDILNIDFYTLWR